MKFVNISTSAILEPKSKMVEEQLLKNANYKVVEQEEVKSEIDGQQGAEGEQTPEEPTKVNVEDMDKKDIVEYAAAFGIKLDMKMKKDEMLEAIK